ncbi:NAD(P)-dependent oxidoreductase [Kitasatospora sp. NPDC058190]|uniref:NAD(P)-dependent oxidoreductase n=1 Tax=Kitasatospora sp. NPDC058190 TaxID=3346371 RepID=UPI0036DB99AF
MSAPAASRPTALIVAGATDRSTLAQALPDWTVRNADSIEAADDTTTMVVLRSGVRLGADQLRHLPALRHVIRAGSGLDGLDLPELASRGISVHRNPAPAADSVAQWALAAILSLARRIPLGQSALAAGVHLKAGCLTRPLTEARLAIWGAGPIGQACEGALAPHVGEIAYAARPSIPAGIHQLPATALTEWADIHLVALPGTPENQGAFGPAFLASARERRPMLVCVGRLATLDVPACLEALDEGNLAGLALDPVEREDMRLLPRGGPPRNLIATPHIGAQRTDVRDRLDTWVATTARTAADRYEQVSP